MTHKHFYFLLLSFSNRKPRHCFVLCLYEAVKRISMPFDVKEGEGMRKAQEVQGTGIKNQVPRFPLYLRCRGSNVRRPWGEEGNVNNFSLAP